MRSGGRSSQHPPAWLWRSPAWRSARRARAAEETTWIEQRRQAFDGWRGARPDLEDRIEDAASRTADALARHAKREQERVRAELAELRARSRGLSGARRERIRALEREALSFREAGDCGAAEPLFGDPGAGSRQRARELPPRRLPPAAGRPARHRDPHFSARCRRGLELSGLQSVG
jgi:hypothetical protein